MAEKNNVQFTITIPEPCSEDWNKMRVVDSCHRHCAACERTLTDFAQMNDDELLLFLRHSGNNICGRFRKDQLNRPLQPIPEKTTKAKWWKAAALLPLSLFSKNVSAQQLYPDSVRTEQEGPVAIQQDSVSPVYTWKLDSLRPWIDTEERGDFWVGGVPMLLITTNYICSVTYIDTVVTEITPVPPKNEASLGIEAAASPPPVKNPDAPESARMAQPFVGIVPDPKK